MGMTHVATMLLVTVQLNSTKLVSPKRMRALGVDFELRQCPLISRASRPNMEMAFGNTLTASETEQKPN